jgi:hypothetical protein
MKELHTEIEIAAPAERVWRILTDFSAYPQWNPFMRLAQGTPEPPNRLEIVIQPGSGPGMVFRPTVLQASPPRTLRWLGRLWLPGIFDGEHIFEIEPQGPGRVRFVQREIFKGFLVPFAGRRLQDTLRGFEEMNRALKARAEENDRR